MAEHVKREILTHDRLVEAIACACHQQNRVWCMAHDDDSQVSWLEAPAWQRESVIAGVKAALQGTTPEESHNLWWKRKYAEGWTYGPAKNVEEKTHPCMVPYSELDETQKRKDEFFVAMVRELGGMLGLMG